MHGVSWRFFEHPGRRHMNAFPLHQSCLASGSTCHLPRDKPSQLLCCMHAQGTWHWALAMVAVALPGGQLMSHEPGANCAYKTGCMFQAHACMRRLHSAGHGPGAARGGSCPCLRHLARVPCSRCASYVHNFCRPARAHAGWDVGASVKQCMCIVFPAPLQIRLSPHP